MRPPKELDQKWSLKGVVALMKEYLPESLSKNFMNVRGKR